MAKHCVSEHYYSEKQHSQKRETEISAILLGERITIMGVSGVFASKKIDKGTFVLIESANIKRAKKIKEITEIKEAKKKCTVLDLGCGTGVVGIAIQKKYPECIITYVDINERALAITRKNLKKNKCEGRVIKSFCYRQLEERSEDDNEEAEGVKQEEGMQEGIKEKKKFDIILCNIPQKAGKEVCLEMIQKAPEHLEKGGSLQIVALHNKGGKTLKKVMKEVFGNVQTLARSGGYHVYSSILE